MFKKIKDKILKNKKIFAIIATIFAFLSIQIVLAALSFNSDARDYPLSVGNHTQNPGQTWATSLTSVNPGDELRFRVYYHNAATVDANNTKVELSLSSTSSATNFTATSKISATSFDDYITNASINLTSAQTITFQNTAQWYHNYNGTAYQIDNINVVVSGGMVSFDLGTVNPGYAPNDGYIIFTGLVSNAVTPKNFNSDAQDSPLNVGNHTQNPGQN
ncbi:MAG: hypothetical protein WC178_05325, partial [Candidatus Paceibacterota bacterium]